MMWGWLHFGGEQRWLNAGMKHMDIHFGLGEEVKKVSRPDTCPTKILQHTIEKEVCVGAIKKSWTSIHPASYLDPTACLHHRPAVAATPDAASNRSSGPHWSPAAPQHFHWWKHPAPRPKEAKCNTHPAVTREWVRRCSCHRKEQNTTADFGLERRSLEKQPHIQQAPCSWPSALIVTTCRPPKTKRIGVS